MANHASIGSSRTHQTRSVVVAVVFILFALLIVGAVVGANVFVEIGGENVQGTKTQMINIEKAIKLYKLEKRKLPASLQDLVPTHLDTEGGVPTDSWGNEFLYALTPEDDYALISLGADGVEGGEETEEADIQRADLRFDN